MEAVAADGVLSGKLYGNGVEIGFRRHIGVESCLEGANHGGVRHQRLELADSGDIRRIVGRGYGVEIRHGLQHVLCQILDTGNAFGMNHLKAHTGDLFQRGDDACQQMFQHSADGFSVGGENGLHADIVAGQIVLVIKQTLGSAHTLSAAGSQHFLAIVHGKQLIFQGSASHIADQNIHSLLLCR